MNRAQVQRTIKSRIYFLSSSGPPCFRSTFLPLSWDVLLLFYYNISALTGTKFLIAFIMGNCAGVTKTSGFLLLYSSQVGCGCAQLMFVLRSRLQDCFTSIIVLRRGRCGGEGGKQGVFILILLHTTWPSLTV